MTPELWETVKTLFERALEIPESQRSHWIESQRANPEVEREILRLLHEHETADTGFLGVEAQGMDGLLDRAARVLASSVSEPTYAGSVLSGRYEVVRELGSGGNGVVYLAQDRALHNRPVVLKFLFPGSESQERMSRRFRLEIEALARIRHPAVVGALDVGRTDDDRVFLVMEYVEGTTLREELKAPMALSRVSSLITQIARALSAAHQAGILHRDLKPENVMLQRAKGEESVKLIDFGIAKVQYSDPGDATHTVTFVGTINYVAPEQLMGRATAATDVYALGILAYELLTGRRPFDPETPFALYELQRGPVPPPSRIRKELSQAADRAILRALAFDAAKRQESPEDFARELAAGLTRGNSRFRQYRAAVMSAAAFLGCLSLFFLGDRSTHTAPTIVNITGDHGEQFGHIQATARGAGAAIYFAASGRNKIYRLDPGAPPKITLLAGSGEAGFSGDGGDPLRARMNNPLQLAIAPNGDVYFVDQRNQRIRMISAKDRTISTVAGSGVAGFSGDGGDPKLARFYNPFGLAMDSQGELFVADQANNRVRRIHLGANPKVATIAGTGTVGFSGDGGDPVNAQLIGPTGLAFDSHGNLYISDQQNNRIRVITFGAHPIIRTVVGNGAGAYTGDGGDPMAATMSGPKGLAFDRAGNLYIADEENHAIRVVTFGPRPVIRTVAGSGLAGSSGDGGPATAARLSLPNAVSIGADGNLYIGDGLNDRIRMVNLSRK